MFGRIKRLAAETNYKMKMKPVLEQATTDELKILKELVLKELAKRSKKRWNNKLKRYLK